MTTTRTLSIIALLTSLIISSDYALAPIPNVKLLDTLVFASAYSFGFKIGASIAMLSEFIWGVVSPYGGPTPIILFLISGEILFALAGWGVSKVWGGKVKLLSTEGLYFGAIVAVCAFVWDSFTNFGTAIIYLEHISWSAFIFYEIQGGLFMFYHEVGDFALCALFAPIAISYLSRVFPKNSSHLAEDIGEIQKG